MEFPHIGKNCSYTSCNKLDFLPYKCGACKEVFCFRLAKFVTFTASADHRVIDGAVGAQWMKAFKENMEDPANMIL